MRDFLYTTESRSDLKPTQPPVQWVLGAISLGYSSLGMKLTTHLLLVLRSGIAKLYLHSPIHPHCVVLN
jgi:hypothetical protein